MKTAKQISQYLKSRPYFKEYIYEIHTCKGVISKDEIEDYINGRKDVYTLSGAFDWSNTNAGTKVWQERQDEFWNWVNK